MAESDPNPKKPAAPAATEKKAKGKGLPILIVVALLAAQGVGVFFLTKMLSGTPQPASAADVLAETESQEHPPDASGGHDAPAHPKSDAKHEAGPADDGHGAKPAHDSGAPSKDADHGKKPKDDGHAGADSAGHGAGSASVPGITDDYSEVKLCEIKTINRETGRLILIQVRVSALAAASDMEKLKKLAESKQSRIEDRVNTLIRSAQPRHLGEPGLETLKRGLKVEMDRIIGDEKIIKEVLIPQLLQSGSGL